jgi:branched-chain amino acid transport system substrate-binding protein
MKRFGFGIGILVVLALSLGARAQLTIGVDLSTTGPGASLGIPEKNALVFAPSVIAGQKVRYVVYDDATDPTMTVRNVKRLISEDKIDILLGPSITVTSLAAIDPGAEGKTPVFSFASAAMVVAPMDEKRRWIFKIGANEDVYAAAIVRHMMKKGVKTVSLISFDDPFGETNTQVFSKLAEQKGIKVVTVERFKRTDTSVTGQVLRAMKGNPDAVYVIAVGTPSALPHMTLIEHGYKGRVYHTGSVANADFLRVGGKTVEGALLGQSPVFVADQLPDGYPTKPEALKYAKAYQDKFGIRADAFASQVWDSFALLQIAVPRALKKGKPGTVEFREALRTAVENIKGYKGAHAVYSFTPTDHAGVNDLGIAMIRVENGGWKLEDYADFK